MVPLAFVTDPQHHGPHHGGEEPDLHTDVFTVETVTKNHEAETRSTFPGLCVHVVD